MVSNLTQVIYRRLPARHAWAFYNYLKRKKVPVSLLEYGDKGERLCDVRVSLRQCPAAPSNDETPS